MWTSQAAGLMVRIEPGKHRSRCRGAPIGARGAMPDRSHRLPAKEKEWSMESFQRPRRRRRPILLALLMTGTALMAATGATMSLAVFTQQQAVAGNGFTTGTIALSVTPVSAIFTSAAMMPGDVVPVGVPGAPVTVSNAAGTASLRYAITGASTDDGKHLDTQLLITVRRADGNAGASCTLFTGDVLFASAVVPVGPINMVGDPAQGVQTGDRPLAGGASETLCFKASLPLGTPIAYQGATSTYTFTFIAEQTANNP